MGVKNCNFPDEPTGRKKRSVKFRPATISGSKTDSIADAVTFAIERLGFHPDAKQAEVLRSQAKRGILNCTRQWGKSTTAAAKAVHRAYTAAGSLVLVASPTERQSGEFVRKAGTFLMKLDIAPR